MAARRAEQSGEEGAAAQRESRDAVGTGRDIAYAGQLVGGRCDTREWAALKQGCDALSSLRLSILRRGCIAQRSAGPGKADGSCGKAQEAPAPEMLLARRTSCTSSGRAAESGSDQLPRKACRTRPKVQLREGRPGAW